MNDPKELTTKALRGTLSEAEKQEWEELLRRSPDLRAEFAEEAALSHLLEQLPNAPISSNFTSLVVQAAMLEPRPRPGFLSRFRLPYLRPEFSRGVALLVILSGLGLTVGYQYKKSQRTELSRSVRSFAEVASVIASDKTPPEQLFQDFEAIQRLSLPAEGELDMELLVALQK